MPLSPDILSELTGRLQRDFAFRKTRGTWLQEGKCPDCRQKTVYVHRENPAVIKCGRLDNCGWEVHVRDHYPEIFDSWSNRYKPTRENPTASADAYLLHNRGLDLRGLRGHYSQETFKDHERKIDSATVRFPLPGGGWWERLIDQPGRFDRKARFAPGKSYAGHWWHRPDVTLADLAAAESIWIAEGIFDALAIEQSGQRAVSIMSCYNYPAEALKELRVAIAGGATPHRAPKLIWALDLGKAGTTKTREFVDRSREEGWQAGAAQSREDGEEERKLDWNDLLLLDKLGADRRADYLWNGEILIAPTAAHKAHLIYERHKTASFPLIFRSRTWWAHFDAAAIEERVETLRLERVKKLDTPAPEELAEWRAAAARDLAEIEEIANCAFRVLYRQRDEAQDETVYFLNIDFPAAKAASVKGGFTAAQLRKSSNFEDRLFAFGGIWTGSQFQLNRILQRQTPRIPDVQPLEFTGYSRDHGAYVFGDIAVKDGRVYKPNDDGFFQMGDLALKLGTTERILDIDYDPEELDTSWIEDLWIAYGAKGIVTVTFFFATLFAEQIRRDQKSFPFFEMFGLPGSGKTTLVEFLWRLLGRENYEGFDPAKATPAAMARNLGKVGNLPVVLIEGDRRDEANHSKKFEWEELKTAYNGRSVRSRGVKNKGMETFEPPFRGGIVIEQNEPVSASRAILERIMSLGFDMSGWNDETKASAQRLEQWPIEKLSGFIIHAVRQEEQILQRFRQAFAMHEEQLLAAPQIRTNRLAKTHGQLLAMLDALRLVVPNLRREQHAAASELIWQMAINRQLAVNSEHPDVTVFWERYDTLEEVAGDGMSLNHHRKDGLIAIRLGEFEQRCAERKLTIPSHTDLLRNLKTSRQRRFVEIGTVNSRILNKPVHCWVFENTGARR